MGPMVYPIPYQHHTTMTAERHLLLNDTIGILRAIAPEVQPETLNPTQPLRRQVDLDSIDWLNFLVGLHERFNVTIAETDYSRLISLDDVVNYLQARLP